MANPISHRLIPLAAGEYDEEEDTPAIAGSLAAGAAAAFWPPFPSFLSDSDSDLDPLTADDELFSRTHPVFSTSMADDDDFDDDVGASGFLGFGGDGLRVAGLGSDSESGDQNVAVEEDLGLPFCWDCLQLEDQRREPNDDFEWENVAVDGDVRDALSIVIGGGGDRNEEEETVVRNLEWEVLLAVNSLGRNPIDPDDDIETYFIEGDGDEPYDLLFGHLAANAAVTELDVQPKGGIPAAKSFVESLPTIVVAKGDAASGEMHCAVCKDGILSEEKARKLPCSHIYHGDCILPWLAIRNTCPLCRHEMPTDDPEHEKPKARREEREPARLRYTFETLPEFLGRDD